MKRYSKLLAAGTTVAFLGGCGSDSLDPHDTGHLNESGVSGSGGSASGGGSGTGQAGSDNNAGSAGQTAAGTGGVGQAGSAGSAGSSNGAGTGGVAGAAGAGGGSAGTGSGGTGTNPTECHEEFGPAEDSCDQCRLDNCCPEIMACRKWTPCSDLMFCLLDPCKFNPDTMDECLEAGMQEVSLGQGDCVGYNYDGALEDLEAYIGSTSCSANECGDVCK